MSRKYCLVLFLVALVNLAVVGECVNAHVPVKYVANALLTLVEILFILFMSLQSGENNTGIYSHVVPVASSTGLTVEVAKRILRFGLEGEHPRLSRADWMRAIASDETQDSYWEWVTKNEMMAEKVLALAGMQALPRGESGPAPAARKSGLKLVLGKGTSNAR